jgi:hypothetical protein
MPLHIGRLSVEEAGRRFDVREALEAVGSPEGQDWRVEILDEPDGCQMIVEGARRLRPAGPEWHQTTLASGETRYRRRICGADECTPRALRHALRQLVWENIEFRENPVWSEDAETADALEQVAWELLSAHELPPLHVRLGTWRGEPGTRRFVCKVEAKTLGEGGVPPWRWWSPILGSVDELATWLQHVLQDRGVRVARRSPVSRPPARAAVSAPAAMA